MPPAPNPTWSSNGGGQHGNLFLEADPEVVAPRAEQRRVRGVAPAPRVARKRAGRACRADHRQAIGGYGAARMPPRSPGRAHARGETAGAGRATSARRADANARRLLAQAGGAAVRGAARASHGRSDCCLRSAGWDWRCETQRRRAVARTAARSWSTELSNGNEVQIAELNVRLEQALAAEARPTATVAPDSPHEAIGAVSPRQAPALTSSTIAKEARDEHRDERPTRAQVTLVHPDGTIKLMVPTDVPLAELMPTSST